jgi:hypothetical protein
MMADLRGEPVEGYKQKDGVVGTLGKIRTVQKKMKQFQVVKQLMAQKMQEAEKQLMSEGQMLLQTLPGDPLKDLDGMNFKGEKSLPGEMEQPPQDDMMMRY